MLTSEIPSSFSSWVVHQNRGLVRAYKKAHIVKLNIVFVKVDWCIEVRLLYYFLRDRQVVSR